MTMSRIRLALGVLIVAGAAVVIFLQYQTHQQLRNENDLLRQQLAELKSPGPAVPAETPQALTSDEMSELLRLRGEVGALRAQTNQIAKLQQQNQQLKDSLATANQTRQLSAAQAATVQAATQAEEERAHTVLQVNTSKQAVLAMLMFASDHQDQFPTNFDQAAAYFGNSGVTTNLNQFEITYRGPLSNVANPDSAILVRSTQPWMFNGKWTKVYGFVDGHAMSHSDPNGNFDEWEQQHVAVLKSQ